MPDLMDQARAAAFLAQARRILEPQGDSAELQNVLENEAVGDHAAGRWDSGVEQAASAVAMGGRLGRPVNVALLMGMANELSFAPAPDLDASFRRVWEISRIANDVWGGQLVVAGSGFATYICYDPRTLASIAHSELGLDRQSETIKPVIRLMAALGDWEAGTPPDAATLDALSIQRQWSSQVDLFLPQFLWRLGRWAEAAERAAATTAAYRAGGAHGFVATFTAWTAAISATAGDFRAAGAIAELVAGTEAHLSDPAVAGWARVDSAIRLARVGESRPAQDELQRAGTMVGDLHRWRGRAGSFHLAEGLIALAQLGPEAAEPAISRAIDVFRQHSGLWWEADAWFLWGEALANEGHAAGARAKLDASLDVYGRLNASGPWLDRVHRELSKL
jgi:hypothetical protein